MTPTSFAKSCLATVEAPPHVASSLEWVYAFERVVAVILLIVLSPILLLTAAAIALLSRSSPLIRHVRVGWQGSPLPMLKFRTMWEWDARRPAFEWIEEVSGPPPISKQACDERINSRFALFCRRYSIDELPQLLHVARGEMSFVGPRPITRAELDDYYADCMEEVLSVRPGITGLWQVMGRNELTYAARRRFDRLFVRRAGFRIYVFVLLRSLPRVIGARGAY